MGRKNQQKPVAYKRRGRTTSVGAHRASLKSCRHDRSKELIDPNDVSLMRTLACRVRHLPKFRRGRQSLVLYPGIGEVLT